MDADRFARAALSRLAEPCDKEVPGLVEQLGAVETVERIRAGRGTLARFGARLAALDTDRDLDIAAKVGARVVVPGDAEWPERLGQVAIPPYCLWVRGPLDLAETVERSVAVVGAALRHGLRRAGGRRHRRRTVPAGGPGVGGGLRHLRQRPPGRSGRGRCHGRRAGGRGGAPRPLGARRPHLADRPGDGLVVSEVAPGWY